MRLKGEWNEWLPLQLVGLMNVSVCTNCEGTPTYSNSRSAQVDWKKLSRYG